MTYPRLVKSLAVLFGLSLLACATTGSQEEEQVEKYEPAYSYEYKGEAEADSSDVSMSIGIINPQYGDEDEPEYSIKGQMAKAIKRGFEDILSGKGFSFKTYDSIEKMTYPQKKEVDFVIYPEIDFGTKWQISDTEAPEGESKIYTTDGEQSVYWCKYKLTGKATISIVAKEPMSGQKMWVKRVEPETPSKEIVEKVDYCSGVGAWYSDSWPRTVQNAWAKSHEDMYNKAMGSLEKYINVEEFKVIAKQSAEVRKKTSF